MTKKPTNNRRMQVERMTQAEVTIRAAIAEVQSMGADPLLKDAVDALGVAFNAVADYTDAQLERSTAVQAEVDKATGA